MAVALRALAGPAPRGLVAGGCVARDEILKRRRRPIASSRAIFSTSSACTSLSRSTLGRLLQLAHITLGERAQPLGQQTQLELLPGARARHRVGGARREQRPLPAAVARPAADAGAPDAAALARSRRRSARSARSGGARRRPARRCAAFLNFGRASRAAASRPSLGLVRQHGVVRGAHAHGGRGSGSGQRIAAGQRGKGRHLLHGPGRRRSDAAERVVEAI